MLLWQVEQQNSFSCSQMYWVIINVWMLQMFQNGICFQINAFKATVTNSLAEARIASSIWDIRTKFSRS
jgi:hypothetical protein